MKGISKVLKILLIAICFVISIQTNAFAVQSSIEEPIIKVAEGKSVSSIIDAANGFISHGKSDPNLTEDAFAEDFIGIGQILVAIGAAVLVITITYMGINWLIAKPDQKAQLKQQLIGWVVAAVVIFGAVTIWELAKQIGETLDKI